MCTKTWAQTQAVPADRSPLSHQDLPHGIDSIHFPILYEHWPDPKREAKQAAATRALRFRHNVRRLHELVPRAVVPLSLVAGEDIPL